MSGILRHKSCGGRVVIDMANFAKLTSPSFSIREGRVVGTLMDVTVLTTSAVPTFECEKCKVRISSDNYGSDITCMCDVCEKMRPAGEMMNHSKIPFICKSCLDEINKCIQDPESVRSSRVRSFVSVLSITKKDSSTPMIDVLSNPVNLKGE